MCPPVCPQCDIILFQPAPSTRSNAVELAGALQGRVDALRRQNMEAAEAQETVAALREQAEEQQKEVGSRGEDFKGA